jgi:two-component system, LuxR family, response regulator FixJ
MSAIDISSDEILIVDDDRTVCSVLSMALTLDGYRVTTFMDGASFIAAARMRSPAGVLLDVYMPDKTGLDILKEIDARNYPAPILIMSGRGDIPTAVEAIKGGAHDFLEKWLDADGIVARVRDAIDGWARQRQRCGNGGSELSPTFPGHDRLTLRERDILNHITAAASNKEMAKILGLSPRTIEVHRIHIMHKLGARNAADLVRIVLTGGQRA